MNKGNFNIIHFFIICNQKIIIIFPLSLSTFQVLYNMNEIPQGTKFLEILSKIFSEFINSMTWDQIIILVFGCSAIWLVGRKEHWKKWGYLCGLLSQPFWFYTLVKNDQWGLFILCCWYTYAWGQGTWNYVLRDNQTSTNDKDR